MELFLKIIFGGGRLSRYFFKKYIFKRFIRSGFFENHILKMSLDVDFWKSYLEDVTRRGFFENHILKISLDVILRGCHQT